MFRRRSAAAVLTPLGLAAMLAQSCGDSRVPPRPSDRPYLVRLDIEGNTRLSAVGETSQLRATTRMSDGTSTDATSAVSWTVLTGTVVSISSSGLLEAKDLGIGTIRATYGPSRINVKVTVTPAGTFVVSGRARQPAASGLSGVLITEPVSARSTVTGVDGEFVLAGLIGTELRLTRDFYEPVTAPVVPFDDQVSIPMQPVMKFNAGSSLSGTVAPNDLAYDIGLAVTCGVCRMVRIQSDTAGMLRATLSSDPPRLMSIWVNGQAFTSPSSTTTTVQATFPVAAGETIIYVGTPSTDRHINFLLATEFEPR
jgi:Big-like domain-containing protein